MNRATHTRRFQRSAAFLYFSLAILASFGQVDLASAADKKELQFTRFPYRFYASNPLTPEPKLLLRFNVPVDPKEVSAHFDFYEKKEKTRIGVKASRPSSEEILTYGKRLLPNSERTEKEISRFVLVEPGRPLFTGREWILKTRAGLRSSLGSHQYLADTEQTLGVLFPFHISSVGERNRYNEDMFIVINHNKYRLGAQFTEEKLADYIEVTPPVEEFKVTLGGSEIYLHGKFKYDQEYQVIVKPGIAGNDRVKLINQVVERVSFEPNQGYVKLPMFATAQNAGGKRDFEIEFANVESIRTRVKRLTGESVIFALNGYKEGYQGDGGKRSIPFSMVSGKTIFTETRPGNADIDWSEKHSLSWKKIDPDQTYGTYYICAEGPSDTRANMELGAQAVVQLTDIGLMWKQNGEDTLIYAFSLTSGEPKQGVSIQVADGEGNIMTEVKADQNGVGRFSGANLGEKGELWLDAREGEDRHVMPFSPQMRTIGLWRFDIPYRYNGVPEGERRTLIFTDRDVYRPGETVYIKAISRRMNSDRLLAPAPAKAQLTVKDSKGRNLLSKTVDFGGNESFDSELALPANGLGYHSIVLDFNDPEKPDDRNWNRIKYHSFNVAEYRPNSFEVKLKSEDVAGREVITVPLSAKYYMGKPLSKARVSWSAYASKKYPRAEGFEEFRFGDPFLEVDNFSDSQETRLGAGGTANIELAVPNNLESPFPRAVHVNAEVTDVNQQTVSGRTSFTVHSSDFYIGIQKPDGIHRAGEKVPFFLANVDTEGNLYREEVEMSVTVEKEIWTSIKVKGADGRIALRNEKHYDVKSLNAIAVRNGADPETNMGKSFRHEIQFTEPGDYVITLEAKDKSGRLVVTKERFSVIGAEEPSWAWHDVVSIDVVPDRKSYRIGDTAKLLVRSPVLGRALITTERGSVKSWHSVEINEHETVVEIPVKKGAAPNLFASVLIIRGSKESPHRYQSADYRLGYCQLNVEDPASEVTITLDTGKEKYYTPGSEVEVAALVTNGDGSPISGAEVTLYAVDEGILSLTGYSTPSPKEEFNAPFPLSVRMGQSLSELFPENPMERDFGNKGYVVGGGGEPGGGDLADLSRIRNDFKAVAFWKPALVTGPDGKVSCRFKAPDNLTSFRVMSVVTKGNRFASAESKVVVNKPLVIEPALPVFTNLSDQIDITAVVHNNTDKVQNLDLSVELDKRAIFLEKLGDVLPTRLSGLPESSRVRERSFSIDSGKTEVLHFPVGMIQTGESRWSWTVRSRTNRNLVDRTESKLAVNYPLPVLRASRNIKLTSAGSIDNILSDIEPRLLQGRGDIEVSISNSQLTEAADALEYLLTYPYGCVEQTTSSTIPWLSTKNMRGAFPQLNVADEEIGRAIARGTGRLLSMQTGDGGLSYWPGEDESILWGSAYGGLALALAKESGVNLPTDRLNDLWDYLSRNLRDTAKVDHPYDLSQRCLAVYTLAVAGRAEPAYHEALFNKREKLPREARALAALAMMRSLKRGVKTDESRIEELLSDSPEKPESKVRWYDKPYLAATELLAWTSFRPNHVRTGQLADELIKLKKQRHGWGSTYSNAWPLMALAQYSKAEQSRAGSNEVTVRFGDRTEVVKFDGKLASKTLRFPVSAEHASPAMKVDVENAGPVFTHVKVATQPELAPMQPENRGFSVKRAYFEIDQEGVPRPPDDLMVGDLVLVRLDIVVPNDREQYVAIDDPLPSILETVNRAFTTRQTRSVKTDKPTVKQEFRRLHTHFSEIRKDRTLFFSNYIHQKGKYRIEYLARVVAPGDSIAPPAKIEAMYEPERFGLSGTEALSARTLQFKENKVATR